MSKDEFLSRLEEALSDSVPASVVTENIQYYSSYIDEEELKGRSEEEVLGELGDPRLIAHTIIDTTPEAGGGTGYQNSSSRGNTYSSGRTGRRSESKSSGIFNIDMSKWYWRMIVYIALVLVVMLVISVLSGIMSLLFPILPIVIVVAFMMWMFGGGRR